jgi:hypothetical protein
MLTHVGLSLKNKMNTNILVQTNPIIQILCNQPRVGQQPTKVTTFTFFNMYLPAIVMHKKEHNT